MSKINKLGKSTFVIAILSFLLVAVLAFGGTYAYFSDAVKADTTVTMGHLTLTELTASSTITTDTKAVPNQPVFDAATPVAATVSSNIKYFARVTLAIGEVDLANAHADEDGCPDEGLELLEVGAVAGWEKDGNTNVYYNLTPYAAGASVSIPLDVTINKEVGQQSSEHFMDATVTVTVTIEVIQADYILDDGADVAGATAELADLKAAFDAANIKAAA